MHLSVQIIHLLWTPFHWCVASWIVFFPASPGSQPTWFTRRNHNPLKMNTHTFVSYKWIFKTSLLMWLLVYSLKPSGNCPTWSHPLSWITCESSIMAQQLPLMVCDIVWHYRNDFKISMDICVALSLIFYSPPGAMRGSDYSPFRVCVCQRC